MKLRRGYSLVEALVVLALTSVTLTVTTVTMHSLHRAERRFRDDLREQQALDRLAGQLRWDGHEAVLATLVEGTDGQPSRKVTLTCADNRSIEYVIARKCIERVVKRNETIEQREAFCLAYPESHWSIDTIRDFPLLALHLVHRDPFAVTSGTASIQQPILTTVGIAAGSKRKSNNSVGVPAGTPQRAAGQESGKARTACILIAMLHVKTGG